MFWIVLCMVSPGFRRLVRWLLLAFLIFCAWAFINYARHPAHAQIAVVTYDPDGEIISIVQELAEFEVFVAQWQQRQIEVQQEMPE